ncbi:MAG: hypothetical protein H6923_04340 [Alphaproteobacteria bacterium]|nr:hypothetical protein [Alphaproteobacteria bacterium]
MVLGGLFGGGKPKLPERISDSFFNRYFAGLTHGTKRPNDKTWRTVRDLVERLEPSSELRVWFMGFLQRTGGKLPSESQWQEISAEVARVRVDESAIPEAWRQSLSQMRNIRLEPDASGKRLTDNVNADPKR